MMRSTCICILAICLVYLTMIPSSCVYPLVNVGCSSREQYCPTESCMSKPQSARTALPGTRVAKQCTMLGDIFIPTQPSDMKLTVP